MNRKRGRESYLITPVPFLLVSHRSDANTKANDPYKVLRHNGYQPIEGLNPSVAI